MEGSLSGRGVLELDIANPPLIPPGGVSKDAKGWAVVRTWDFSWLSASVISVLFAGGLPVGKATPAFSLSFPVAFAPRTGMRVGGSTLFGGEFPREAPSVDLVLGEGSASDFDRIALTAAVISLILLKKDDSHAFSSAGRADAVDREVRVDSESILGEETGGCSSA